MERICTYETVTNRKVTIKDIAKKAGVSTATVSNAFSGKGNLSASKREEILSLASELEYVPSPAAKALFKGNVRIAVILPENPKVLTDRFRAGFIRAMKKQPCVSMECTFFSYRTVNEYFRSAAQMVIDGGYDGLILSYPDVYEERNADYFARLNRLGIPCVSLISPLSLFRSDAYIGVDAECGGRLAADILGNLLSSEDGIAVFTADTKIPGIHKRYIDGFEKELGFYGMGITQTFPGCEHTDAAYEYARKCFSRKDFPKGIFVTPYSSWVVSDAAKDAGVLDRVRIIGVDTVENNVRRLIGGEILALIDQRQELQAERALTETIRLLLGNGISSDGTVTPHIVTRGRFVPE